MSPIHRESDGTARAGRTWPSLVERLIVEAQERGELDDLPLRGRPLRDWDDERAGDMRLAFHVLRNAGIAPPWIEADKEVRRLLEERCRLVERARGAPADARSRYRRQLTRLIRELESAVEQLNSMAPTLSLQRSRPTLATELEALELAFEELSEPDR